MIIMSENLPSLQCLVSPRWVASVNGLLSLMGHQTNILEELCRETTLLDKLMYKNANQHRGTRPFHRLQEVRRLLRWVPEANAMAHLRRLHDLLTLAARSTFTLQERYVPTASAAISTLRRLLSACHLAEEIARALLGAAHQSSSHLAHGFFMPLSLACLAILSRVRILNAQLLLDSVNAYNATSELLDMLPVADGKEREMVVDGLKGLPSMIRCDWIPEEQLPRLSKQFRSEQDLLDLRAEAKWSYVSLGLIVGPQNTGGKWDDEDAQTGAECSFKTCVHDGSRSNYLEPASMDVDLPPDPSYGTTLGIVEDRGIAVSREEHMAMLRTATVSKADAMIQEAPPSYIVASDALTCDFGPEKVASPSETEQALTGSKLRRETKRQKKKHTGKVVMVPSHAEEKLISASKKGVGRSEMRSKICTHPSEVRSSLPSLSARSTAFISVETLSSAKRKDADEAHRKNKSKTDSESHRSNHGDGLKSWEDWLSVGSRSNDEVQGIGQARTSQRRRKRR